MKMSSKLFTFDEVKALLCEGCKLGLATTTEMGSNDLDNKNWHCVNGTRVTCTASRWRSNRAAVEKAFGKIT